MAPGMMIVRRFEIERCRFDHAFTSLNRGWQ